MIFSKVEKHQRSNIKFFCHYSDVLSSPRLLHLLRHQLQELLGTWLDREIQNEYENVSTLDRQTENGNYSLLYVDTGGVLLAV